MGAAPKHVWGRSLLEGQCAAADLHQPIAPPRRRLRATMEEYHRHCDEVPPLGHPRATPAPARLGAESPPGGLPAPGGRESWGAAPSGPGSSPQGRDPPRLARPGHRPRGPEGGLRAGVAGAAKSARGGRGNRDPGVEGRTRGAWGVGMGCRAPPVCETGLRNRSAGRLPLPLGVPKAGGRAPLPGTLVWVDW